MDKESKFSMIEYLKTFQIFIICLTNIQREP